MQLRTVLAWLCTLSAASSTISDVSSASNRTEAVLSRRKRYLTFPEGSTYSFAFCMEVKAVTQDYDLYTEGVAVSANYDLPDKPEEMFTTKPPLPAPVLRRRHRRDLYGKVEKILNMFLSKLHELSLEEVLVASKKLVDIYNNDLEDDLGNELVQFKTFPEQYRDEYKKKLKSLE